MTSEIKKSVSGAVKAAMRAKEKDRLAVLRSVMAEFKRIEVDERIELDDARVLTVLDKLVKQRKDSEKQFRDNGRDDLAEIEAFEIGVIKDFLPEPLTQEEINSIVSQAIHDSGAGSMQEMGKVMALVKPQVQGRADMGEVSKAVKSLLN